METKQVIIVRKDLKMPPGKLAAQVSHASMAAFFEASKLRSYLYDEEDLKWKLFRVTPPVEAWISNSFTKVVVKVKDLDELWDTYMEVMGANIPCSIIKDAGRTVFKEATFTCVGVGPAEVEKIDKVVGHLKLY